MSTAEGGGNIVTDGLVLYLDAANSKSIVSGSTTWTDLSRSNSNGTLIGGPTFDPANGGSILFDGTDDYVSFPSNISLTNKITVEVWVNLNSTTRNVGWILGRDGSYRLIYASNSFTWVCATTNNAWYSNGTNINADSLATAGIFQVVGTYDGANNKIYVNGVLITTGGPLSGNILNTSTYNLFKTGANNVDYGKGKLYLHRFYNRAISSQEILQNYNATKRRFGL